MASYTQVSYTQSGEGGGVRSGIGAMEARAAALMRDSAKRIASHNEGTLEAGIAMVCAYEATCALDEEGAGADARKATA